MAEGGSCWSPAWLAWLDKGSDGLGNTRLTRAPSVIPALPALRKLGDPGPTFSLSLSLRHPVVRPLVLDDPLAGLAGDELHQGRPAQIVTHDRCRAGPMIRRGVSLSRWRWRGGFENRRSGDITRGAAPAPRVERHPGVHSPARSQRPFFRWHCAKWSRHWRLAKLARHSTSPFRRHDEAR